MRAGPATAMLPLVLLLLSAATRVQLVDEPFEIPAHDWRFDSELGLHQRAAHLIAQYQVKSGGPVRLLLMTREDVDQMSEGRRHTFMAAAGPASTGSMRYNVTQPGEYALVVDNRENDRPARVHLSVWLDFPAVTTISPVRQLTVILLSFAFFFGVVTWSARRLWKTLH
jgi:hypothetical protein